MSEQALQARPRVGSSFRLQWEEAQQAWVLLFPEGMVKLNGSAGEIMKRCNGTSSVAEIVADLEGCFGVQGLQGDVLAFLDIARGKHWVEGLSMDATHVDAAPPSAMTATNGAPLWLLAEITYRCPLHCVYCYNPVYFALTEHELATDDWIRVLREARALGSVQCGFSGGEPLVRDDLEILVAEAHRLGYYTNLLTSGVGLTEERAARLKAGLDHIQLSFQDSTREMNDFLSHTKTFELKQRVARMIKANGWPMVLNVVLHRMNVDYIDKIIEMAVELKAEYLELANSQYYSWAHVNRDHLLPSREQLQRAERITNEYRARLGDRIRMFFVVPDFYENRPKKCMNGWGNVFLTITPDGTALPRHTAKMLPGLTFPNVRGMDVRSIWYESDGFNRFRGKGWMKEPCRSCPEQDKDLGGCRCQAYMLTGDPANADPVCDKSPLHGVIAEAVDKAQRPDRERTTVHPLVFRDPMQSRRLSPAKTAV